MKTTLTNPFSGINQYFIDRWIGTYISAVLEEDGLLITSDRTPTFSMYQRVENPQEFSGKTVTFSILCSEAASVTMAIRGDTGSGSTNVGGKNLAVDTPGLHTITCTLPPNITVLAPGFLVRAGGRIKIAAAKLELGSQQTLAHRDASGNWVLNDPPPDPALELAKCQRYQFVIRAGMLNDPYPTVGMGIARSAAEMNLMIPLPTTMRARPSISVEGNGIYVRNSMDTGKNLHNIEVDTFNGTTLLCKSVLEDGNFTVSGAYQAFLAGPGNSSKVVIDANL